MILNTGIYFYQFDHKEEPLYSKNSQGELIKVEYKAPSHWEKSKFFITYGYAMNTETIYTNILWFDLKNNKVFYKTFKQNAVTAAKHIRDNKGWYFLNEKMYDVTYHEREIELCLDTNLLSLEFTESGRNLIIRSKKLLPDNKNYSKYTFLDWSDL